MEVLRATRVMLVQGTGFNWTTSTFASSSCRTRRPARGHRRLAKFLEQYRKRHAKPASVHAIAARSCSRLIGAGQNGFCLDFRYLR
jgi:alanine-synthesizing transaminase